jgi:hypothetical protein
VRWFHRPLGPLIGVGVFAALGLAAGIYSFVAGSVIGGLLFLGMFGAFVWSVIVQSRVGITATGFRFGVKTIELADVSTVSFRAVSLRRLGIQLTRFTVLVIQPRQGGERRIPLFRPAKLHSSPEDYAALVALLRTRDDFTAVADQIERLLAASDDERKAFFRALQSPTR